MYKPVPRKEKVADQRRTKGKPSIPQSILQRSLRFLSKATGRPLQDTMQIALATSWIRQIPRLNLMRNHPCHCGSEIKFKHCHLREVEKTKLQYRKVQHNDLPRSLRIAGYPSVRSITL